PIRPLSPDGVGTLVYRACERAGVTRVGPHTLRRTLATETLRAGGSNLGGRPAAPPRRPGHNVELCRRRCPSGGGVGPAVAGGAAMTDLNPTLQGAAEGYLALRRSFGYRLRGH